MSQEQNMYPDERREILSVRVNLESAKKSLSGKSWFMEVIMLEEDNALEEGYTEHSLGSIMLSLNCKEKIDSMQITSDTPIYAVIATELSGKFAGKPRLVWPAQQTEKDFKFLMDNMMTSNRANVITTK